MSTSFKKVLKEKKIKKKIKLRSRWYWVYVNLYVLLESESARFIFVPVGAFQTFSLSLAGWDHARATCRELRHLKGWGGQPGQGQESTPAVPGWECWALGIKCSNAALAGALQSTEIPLSTFCTHARCVQEPSKPPRERQALTTHPGAPGCVLNVPAALWPQESLLAVGNSHPCTQDLETATSSPSPSADRASPWRSLLLTSAKPQWVTAFTYTEIIWTGKQIKQQHF